MIISLSFSLFRFWCGHWCGEFRFLLSMCIFFFDYFSSMITSFLQLRYAFAMPFSMLRWWLCSWCHYADIFAIFSRSQMPKIFLCAAFIIISLITFFFFMLFFHYFIFFSPHFDASSCDFLLHEDWGFRFSQNISLSRVLIISFDCWLFFSAFFPVSLMLMMISM